MTDDYSWLRLLLLLLLLLMLCSFRAHLTLASAHASGRRRDASHALHIRSRSRNTHAALPFVQKNE